MTILNSQFTPSPSGTPENPETSKEMGEPVRVDTDESGRQTVDARELHEFLESKQQFADWIKNQIRDYGFVENSDYVVFHNSMKNPTGGRPRKEYHITIETAKELSMVERNAKGKMARLYFIECERRAKDPVYMLKDPVHLRRLIKDMSGRVIKLEEQKTRMLPKAAFADSVTASDTSIPVGGLAKLLRQNGIKTGQNRLFQWLRDNGYVQVRKGPEYNLPTQKSMELGVMEIPERTGGTNKGGSRIIRTTHITGKGQVYFINKFLDIESTGRRS